MVIRSSGTHMAPAEADSYAHWGKALSPGTSPSPPAPPPHAQPGTADPVASIPALTDAPQETGTCPHHTRVRSRIHVSVQA